MKQFSKAADLFGEAGRQEEALFSRERPAQLDPENLTRQLRVAETAERLGKNPLAAKAFLRAGQLATAGGTPEEAIRRFGSPPKLAPQMPRVAPPYPHPPLPPRHANQAPTL